MLLEYLNYLTKGWNERLETFMLKITMCVKWIAVFFWLRISLESE